jgi:hypothetical protein
LRLMDSRRLLPTMTAILTFAMAALPWFGWFRFDTKAR